MYLNIINKASINIINLICSVFYNQHPLYLYTYNHIYEEKEGHFYKFTENDIYFYNGLVSIHGSDEIPNIDNIFDTIHNNNLILGDFQAIHLNSDNDVFIKTSKSSIYPIFYFEDEDCFILSNELKLIVDGINSFRTNFVNNYDYEYMEDVFYKGFFNKQEREEQRKTIFKNIERILPQDNIYIKNGSVHINQNFNIDIPKWFEDWYFEDKNSLYDWYYNSLIEYSDSLLNVFQKNINEIQPC